ncbi:sensor histidine kinase [Mucilaginibacter paludis]|uniref:histidine kinase n=1 Tax=Mucilaginibacter paludis DSM 18603 TaxID=714943 RepID=H1YBK1_9SPHI|nr:HAMP domain-containing sensor histidine kinase [Mucilaginibacter paludis]EHQ25072.1 integral membrane sensor signal transduction histidine kinase [Mucilaginibacter paludis DSM 18603]
MKKHILLILVLMSLCVTGIVGLQLFWNYQNYRTTVRAFDHDINEALNIAVAKETDQRQEQIVTKFKGWLADTSLIIITADHKNRDSMTVFYTRDAHPKFKEDKKSKSQFGLNDFKEKLDHITPKAKALMIKHFGDRILKRDLKEGIVYYYTQMLGDSLVKVFNASKVKPPDLEQLFKRELANKNINAPFVFNPTGQTGLYLTRKVNTNFRKPFKNDFVYAGIESPNTYFFKEMKWVIITSLLLIIITISCFTYTVRTLLSQQKLAELKEDFINNMTHELNTPISSIKITTEALKTFKYNPDIQREYLDMISYQSDKLQDLTSKILNTGRLIKNHSANWTEIDFNELVSAAINDLRPLIESHDAIVDYRPSEAAPSIRGDISSLRNVMVNLIDNALKYATGRPSVSIEVMALVNHAVIKITDNGIGIPREYHAQVFEQFFRVPQGNLHDVKGFGLGLSYVKQVIQQHHGEVTVADHQPTGSVFTIKLPLS